MIFGNSASIVCSAAMRANANDLNRLMGRERAHMAFLDPPYNVRVRDIGGRGQVKHQEFAMASGEMSRRPSRVFSPRHSTLASSVSIDGAVHFVCMDWRHIGELVAAGRVVYGAMLNLIVWVKSNAGQGNFYRSQHELVGVFRVGDCPSPQHHRTRPPWPLTLQCLEICWRQYVSQPAAWTTYARIRQ